MSQGCACTTYKFTTFCQLWTKLDKCESECNVVAMIIFCLCHKMSLLLILEKPNAKNCIHSFTTKKSCYSLEIYDLKVTCKILSNPWHASSQGVTWALHLLSSSILIGQQQNCIVARVCKHYQYFLGGETKGPMSALQGNVSPGLFLAYYLCDLLSVISKQQLNKVTTLVKQRPMTRFWQICHQYGILGLWEGRRDSCTHTCRLVRQALEERSRSTMDITCTSWRLWHKKEYKADKGRNR